MEILSTTWHWSVSGFIIGLIMLVLTFFGKTFGMSSNLRSLCSMTGVGKKITFFDWDWKSQQWNLVVVLGAIIGGYVAVHFMNDMNNVSLAESTNKELSALGIDLPNGKLLPDFLFSIDIFNSEYKIFILIFGGFLIGFGSRYAGGCTSGHAISGLSNLQIPSLKAVIGFFIGGLIMSHILIPILLK